ncbi:Protein kinase, membrane associated tyrosine threonine 1 [Mortierella claussenii]|nr:Protein kinase, membrane associated tyrosine threonine 1 [Mortierella claussenii]
MKNPHTPLMLLSTKIPKEMDLDRNPFLASSSSPDDILTRKSFLESRWRTEHTHHISKEYLEDLFSFDSQEVLPKPDIILNEYPDYLSATYIVDESPIGEGEFSHVSRIQDRATGELFAVKVLKNTVKAETRNMWRVKQKHPNVVDLLGVWEQRAQIFMRMELCEHGSLESAMTKQKEKGGFDEKQIWACLRDLSSGLQGIHESGVIHLDLKPGNVFLSESGSLKIGDFGHSIILPVKDTDGLEGDRRYMAPELLNGRCGAFSDIFSLGIIIFEMVSNRCGELPGEGPEWHGLREGLFEFAIPAGRFSETLLGLVKHILQPMFDKRPDAASLCLVASSSGQICGDYE